MSKGLVQNAGNFVRILATTKNKSEKIQDDKFLESISYYETNIKT